jgi:hypothetical protein
VIANTIQNNCRTTYKKRTAGELVFDHESLFVQLAMPRPTIDLEPHKALLVECFNHDFTFKGLSQLLLAEFDISVTPRTLQNRFQSWGIKKNHVQPSSPGLSDRVEHWYFRNYTDEEIVCWLRREGYTNVVKYTVTRIRRQRNLSRRTSAQDIEADNDRMRAALQEELQRGHVSRYGRNYLSVHMKNRRHVVSSKQRLLEVYRELDEAAIDRRRALRDHRRGDFIVPGPNHCWSIDGHDKLKRFGFEIYAAIDTYSRYILWFYIGISNSTQLSVERQYLDTISSTSFQPRFIRSDCGIELDGLADSHVAIRRDVDPGVSFQDCYKFGTSVRNQRIEAWWNVLSKGCLLRWRVRFPFLYDTNS